MKKLLLLSALLIFACSSDDDSNNINSGSFLADYNGVIWLEDGNVDYDYWWIFTPNGVSNAERVGTEVCDYKTDFMALSDVTMAEAWKTYRQSLRDLPASSSPTLDSDGNLDMSSVTFPTEPS